MMALFTIVMLVPLLSWGWALVLGGSFVYVWFCFLDTKPLYITTAMTTFGSVLMSLVVIILILMNLSAPPSLTLKILLLTLAMVLILLFSINNIMLFYLLFEFTLLPMALIILGWGYQPERLSATLYMLFYTIISAMPFMSVVLYSQLPSFSMLVLVSSSNMMNLLLGFTMVLPFLIKTPMYLFHLWLPKAHVEAPVYGSMVLAGVLLKIGGFGLWRVVVIIPTTIMITISTISLVGGVLSALITLCQTDIKALIAYSSVVHMSLVTLSVLNGFILGGGPTSFLFV